MDGRENGRPAANPPAPKSAVSLQLLSLPSASSDALCPLMSEFGEEEREAFTDFLSDTHLFGYTRASSKEHGQQTGYSFTGPV